MKIDEVNKPHRPIPSGRISVENARNYAFFLFAVAIILSFIVSYMINSIWISVIVVIACIIMYFYARNLKAMPLVGNITVAVLTGFCFVIAGTVVSAALDSTYYLHVSIILGLFATFMTLAREIVKDMEEIHILSRYCSCGSFSDIHDSVHDSDKERNYPSSNSNNS